MEVAVLHLHPSARDITPIVRITAWRQHFEADPFAKSNLLQGVTKDRYQYIQFCLPKQFSGWCVIGKQAYGDSRHKANRIAAQKFGEMFLRHTDRAGMSSRRTIEIGFEFHNDTIVLIDSLCRFWHPGTADEGCAKN